MNPDAQSRELHQLAEFQRRHRISLLCVLCTELDGLPRLRESLGDAAAQKIVEQHELLLRDLLAAFAGGLEVRSANGASIVVFDKPSDAVRFAIELQARVGRLARHHRRPLAVRNGIHVGEILVQLPAGSDRVESLNGLQVDICEALCSLAPAGRTLLTRAAYESARQTLRSANAGASPNSRIWVEHGPYLIEGFEQAVDVCEVLDGQQDLPQPPPQRGRMRPLGPAPGSGRFADPDARAETGFLRRFRSPDPQERRLARWGALLCALVGATVLVGRWLDDASYDLAYLLRPVTPPTEVAIVELDAVSAHRLNASTPDHWDRALMATLIERLSALGSRAIAFDVAWVTRSNSPPASDERLLAALRRSGRVIMGAGVDGGGTGQSFESELPDQRFRSAAAWGFSEIRNTDVFRQPNPAVEDVPSLARRTAEVVSGHLPPIPRGAWLNYYGPPGTLPHFSLLSVISNNIPAGTFSNRVVFVGSNLGISNGLTPHTDLAESPWSRWRFALISGVEANATSYLNLTRSEFLRRPAPWLELAWVVAWGLGVGWFLVYFHPARALLCGSALAGGVALAAMAQTWWTHHWLVWLVPAAVQIPVALLWSVSVRVRLLGREARTLRTYIAEHESKSGNSTTPDTQVSRPPDRTASPAPIKAPVPPAQSSPALNQARGPVEVPDHELLRRIGAGAYGEVWLARNIIGSFHAVKIIHGAEQTHTEAVDREFRGLQHYTDVSRSHPGLVHILHVGRCPGTPSIFYVMEAADDLESGQEIEPTRYVARTLSADIQKHGRLPLVEVIQFGAALADALAYLHRQGLIHRDIKPANIIFVRGRPKLADIGLVTTIAGAGDDVSLIGTRGFLPPEGPGAPSADVYSLGKLLYVAATGNPVAAFPSLPGALTQGRELDLVEAFEALLCKACEPIAERRLADAESFAAELRRIAPAANLG